MSHSDQALLAPWRKISSVGSTLTELTVIINKDNRGVSRDRAAEDTPPTQAGSDVDRGVADVNIPQRLP